MNFYPNLYVFLVGDAGTGKSKAIYTAQRFVKNTETHLGPTSMTMASLVDALVEAKRTIIQMPHAAREYNSLYIMADELSAFMDTYEGGLIAGLTKFFDCTEYSQSRRVQKINITIANPQLNILSGSTPSNLLKFVPEYAWEQGFTSRVLLIYSNDRPIIDIFKQKSKELPKDMVYDIQLISALAGEFGWSEEYAGLMWEWKKQGYPPQPDHPKLTHYNSRRFSHVLKLSMIANVDRGCTYNLEREDFNKAMEWILDAEAHMPKIFRSGTGGADSKAMEEILYFVRQHPNGIHQQKIINYARAHIEYASSVMPILNLMEQSGLIKAALVDEFDQKIFIPGRIN
jgi:hypothetical protein